MRNGGNSNLKNYFARYKIASDSPIEYKFKTKASQYYRDKVNNNVFCYYKKINFSLKL